jgi:formate dehydrogenase subunit beta
MLAVQEGGASAAIRDLLWALMENDVVQGLLVPLQAHSREAPAPTLIKNRERLAKANPLAPVMTLNSANIVGLLLSQESGKRLAAVIRPCEARALVELAERGQVRLADLVTVSIDCLGSHDEVDYEMRTDLWGDDVPTRESLRWSRQGQIAPYRFRQACQMCTQPYFDGADISIGVFGQAVDEQLLVMIEPDLAEEIGFCDNGWTRPAMDDDLISRRKTVGRLVSQRQVARRRLLDDIQKRTAELADLLALLGDCTLCGHCQEACPLTSLSSFEMDAYDTNTPEYIAARLLDLVNRSESCAGCGMCEAACHVGLPLFQLTQMIAERGQIKSGILNALGSQ